MPTFKLAATIFVLAVIAGIVTRKLGQAGIAPGLLL